MNEFKQISDFCKYEVNELGEVRNIESKELLTPKKNNAGYYYIVVKDNQGISKVQLLHRVVVMAFLGEIPEGYEVNHINENKEDNTLKNLEVVTHQENISKYLTNHPMTNKLNAKKAALERKRRLLDKVYCVADIIINNYHSKKLLGLVNEKLTEEGYNTISTPTLGRWKKMLS